MPGITEMAVMLVGFLVLVALGTVCVLGVLKVRARLARKAG